MTAIVPVHLYGQIADMDPILDLAARYNLIVVEDACQAHGAEYYSAQEKRWHKAGSMGKAAAFSFYPGKNLGACGEAGAITTDDAEVARKVRMLRDHGQSRKYYHDIEGYNGRLDTIQAGILRAKLKSWRAGTNSAALWRRIRQAFCGRARSAGCRRNRPGRRRFTTSMWCGCRAANKLQAELSAAGMEPPFTIRFRCTCRRRTSGWATNPEIFRSPSAWLRRFCLCPCFRSLSLAQAREVAEKVIQFTGRAGVRRR